MRVSFGLVLVLGLLSDSIFANPTEDNTSTAQTTSKNNALQRVFSRRKSAQSTSENNSRPTRQQKVRQSWPPDKSPKLRAFLDKLRPKNGHKHRQISHSTSSLKKTRAALGVTIQCPTNMALRLRVKRVLEEMESYGLHSWSWLAAMSARLETPNAQSLTAGDWTYPGNGEHNLAKYVVGLSMDGFFGTNIKEFGERPSDDDGASVRGRKEVIALFNRFPKLLKEQDTTVKCLEKSSTHCADGKLVVLSEDYIGLCPALLNLQVGAHAGQGGKEEVERHARTAVETAWKIFPPAINEDERLRYCRVNDLQTIVVTALFTFATNRDRHRRGRVVITSSDLVTSAKPVNWQMEDAHERAINYIFWWKQFALGCPSSAVIMQTIPDKPADGQAERANALWQGPLQF